MRNAGFSCRVAIHPAKRSIKVMQVNIVEKRLNAIFDLINKFYMRKVNDYNQNSEFFIQKMHKIPFI